MPLTVLGEAQIPLLATMLLGGFALKAARVLQAQSVAAGLGPTALFPRRLRRPSAVSLCLVELGLGFGLILTCGEYGKGTAAELVRLSTGLLFLVATFALIELKDVRPDAGCGCFGELSKSPVSVRTIVRSAILAAAALGTIKLPPIQLPKSAGTVAALLITMIAELGLLGALSPEIKDVLVRIGYSAPCELRVVSAEQTLATLRRSAVWRKHADLITDDNPSDIWRELCWHYAAFSSKHGEGDADLVFAMRLERRRPVVLSALVDTATGAVLPWPVTTVPMGRTRWRGAERPSLAPRPDPDALP